MTAEPDSRSAPNTMRAGVTLHAGRYRLREKLGQGGMGSVYLAEDTLLPGRLVAVKENADTSAAAQSQFKREALLLARLRHPNLPQVMDYFIEADGKQYLVMDYVPGENLLELMRQRQGPLPVAEALGIVEQVMQALAYMHTWRDPESGRVRPVIHRDIKPANIKRTPEGRIVLVDFGIAKVEGGAMTGTAVSAKALTPGYAPLEQYGGGTDARSDIYALGATLYALLTGKAPPSATDMAMAADKQRAPLLTGLKRMPPAVAKVIERAMHSLPEDRYQSIAEMYQVLYSRPLASGGVGKTVLPSGQPAPGNRRLGWIAGSLGGLLAVGLGWLLLIQSAAMPGAVDRGTPVVIAPIVSPATVTITSTATATPARVIAAVPSEDNTPTPAPGSTDTPSLSPSPTPAASLTAVPTTTATPTPDATATAIELELVRRLVAIQTAQAPVATVIEELLPIATSLPFTEILPPAAAGCAIATDLLEIAPQHQDRLGCPISRAVVTTLTAEEFDAGRLIWVEAPDRIFVLSASGHWTSHANAWTPQMASLPCPDAERSGYPAMGFGLLWCSDDVVRGQLGVPLGPEMPAENSQIQQFEGGLILSHRNGQTDILFADGDWVSS